MPLPFDLRTLMLFITVIMIARALAFWLVWRSQKNYSSMGAWAWGSTLVAIGLLFVGMRGKLPDAVSIIAGQAAVVGGWMLIDLGFVRAAGRSIHRRHWLVVYGVTMAAVVWWAVVQPHYLARTAVVTAAEVLFDGYAAWSVWQYRGYAQRQRALRWLALALVVMAVSNLIKFQLAWSHGGDALLYSAWQNLQFYLVATVYCVVVTSLCVLLAALHIQEQLDADIVQREHAQEQVRALAYYDPLTQLPNRRLLDDRLQQAVAHAQRMGQHGAALVLDLDNFKPLNDRFGHAVGDALLQQVAKRLALQVRASDTVARLGGDEFVVLLAALDGQPDRATGQAVALAEKIRAALAQPYVLHTGANAPEGSERIVHQCSASIGVCAFRAGVASEILMRADAAMYQAKKAGRNRIGV